MARSLQLPEDKAFQRRSWIVQRIGWIVMAVLLGLAALGVFSNGAFSRTTVSSPSGAIAVRYQWSLRLGATDTMYVEIRDGSRATEVILNPAFLDALRLETIHPAPRMSSAEPDGTHLLFDTPKGRGRIVMSVRPDAIGFADATISVGETDGAERIPFFVFP
jgi:hypothetical protein